MLDEFFVLLIILLCVVLAFILISTVNRLLQVNKIVGGSTGNNAEVFNKHKIKFKCIDELDPRVINFIEKGKLNLTHLSFDSENIKPIKMERLLLPDAPRKPYQRRNFEYKSTLHWGQLKLLLNEIEFCNLLMRLPADEYQLIYIGAGPGHHIPYLASLFPKIKFILYDKTPFVLGKNYNEKQIIPIQEYFTDEEAQKYSPENIPKEHDKLIVGFMSDIRNIPSTEAMVARNMEQQLRWHNAVKPDLTMFKFRLPWDDGFTEYPEGDIYIQPFAGQTSTETRLIVKKGAPMIKYDNRKYEEQLYYYNSITRSQPHEHLFGNTNLLDDKLDTCYDCAALVYIMNEYLSANEKVLDKNSDEYKTKLHELINAAHHEIMEGYDILNRTEKSLELSISNVIRPCLIPCKNRCDVCTRKAFKIVDEDDE